MAHLAYAYLNTALYLTYCHTFPLLQEAVATHKTRTSPPILTIAKDTEPYYFPVVTHEIFFTDVIYSN